MKKQPEGKTSGIASSHSSVSELVEAVNVPQTMGMNALLSLTSLSGFKALRATEVYETNVDGTFTRSLGVMFDEKLAKGFAQTLPNVGYNKVRPVVVLTDGINAFPVSSDVLIMLDESRVRNLIRIRAIAKLSPEEQEILGVPPAPQG